MEKKDTEKYRQKIEKMAYKEQEIDIKRAEKENKPPYNFEFAKCGNLYFVTNPITYSDADVVHYTTLCNKKRSSGPTDFRVEARTDVQIKKIDEALKKGKPIVVSGGLIPIDFVMGIDVTLLNQSYVFELCDTIIDKKRFDLFNLIYFYGNLPLEQYLEATKHDTAVFYRYIDKPTKTYKICPSVVEGLEIEELKKYIVANKLHIAVDETDNLMMFRVLNSVRSVKVLPSLIKRAEVLFSHGAIAFTAEQLKTLYNCSGGSADKIYPAINQCYLAKFCEKQKIEEVISCPFLSKKEKEKEQKREQEAEDEMDKIYAEAQKNVEMER